MLWLNCVGLNKRKAQYRRDHFQLICTAVEKEILVFGIGFLAFSTTNWSRNADIYSYTIYVHTHSKSIFTSIPSKGTMVYVKVI